MLKKTIKYTDFNGDEVTEDFFFHLSKAELVELEMSEKGGLSDRMQRIIAAEDGKAIMDEFKKIILMAYGQRSDDGKRFIKNKALSEEFGSSEAYSELFMELVTKPDEAAAFVNGLIPAGMAEQLEKQIPSNDEKPTISQKELVELEREQLAETLQQISEGKLRPVE